MQKENKLGTIMGLQLSAEPLFIVGTLILWIILSGTGILMLDLPVSQAVVGGLTAAILYWLSEIVHQLGHAFAAYRTGHPMIGIRLGTYLFFSTSLYPEDEEPLAAEIHIRRALGGPTISFMLTIATGVVLRALYPAHGVLEWMVFFVFIVNLLVFTLGSFLPLGFTDGSTLLKWWRKR